MATNAGTLEMLARELGSALQLLQNRLETGGPVALLVDLGLRPPADVMAHSELTTAMSSALTHSGELGGLIVDLTDAIDDNNLAEIIEAGVQLLAKARDVIDDIAAIGSGLAAAASALSDDDLKGRITEFAAELPRRLLDLLLLEYAEQRAPELLGGLELLGLAEQLDVPAADPLEPPHTRRALHLDRLGKLIADPGAFLVEAYGWGGNSQSSSVSLVNSQFDSLPLLTALHRFLVDRLDFAAVLLTPAGQPPVLEAYLFSLHADVNPNPTPALVTSLRFPAMQPVIRTFPLRKPWSVTLTASGTFAADVQGRITPPAHLELKQLNQPNSAVSATVDAALVAQPENGVIVLLGQAGGTRLQAAKVAVSLGFDLAWQQGQGKATGRPTASAQLQDGKLVISLGGADSFLTRFLPEQLEIDLNLAATWNPEDGLAFSGGAELTLSVPVDAELGPARVDRLDFTLRIAKALSLEIRAAAGIELGPFAAGVDGVGAGADLGLHAGNLGPLDLGFRFIPPTGIALGIDAGPVSGEGFVKFDPPAGRYGGAIAVQFGTIGIDAVVLLDTKLPGGAEGFALLVILRGTFPPIQLGFGFALTAVGGLLALNRRVDVDALRDRMASGTIGRILAPEDPVRNAPVLLADLSAVFPPTEGVVVVGPTLQLTWAQLIRFDMGLFIELPGPQKIVILGSARAELASPSGDTPYLLIRLDILGVIDFAREVIEFDAVLVDSHLLQILQLSGGAAFRLSWGAEPYVVLTIGGFHPAYSPAPLVFPSSLTRIAMVTGTPSSTLYLRFEGYFAITSNSYQYGAAIEVIINLGPLNLRGFLGFDALIQISPFRFAFGIRASVKVRWKSFTLAGLDLEGDVTGPGPVIFHGRVCFEILWFEICFEETFTLGSSDPPPVTPVASAVAKLAEELDKPGNLRAVGAADRYVAVEPATGTALPVVSPLGQVVWSQQRAPLDLLLQRFEGLPLSRPEMVHAEGALVTGAEMDWFAPGSFAVLSSADSLNRRAYERLAAGVQLGLTGTDTGPSDSSELTVNQIRLPAKVMISLDWLLLHAWIQRHIAARLGEIQRDLVVPAFTVQDEKWDVHGPAGGVVAGNVSQAQAHQLATVGKKGVAVASPDVVGPISF